MPDVVPKPPADEITLQLKRIHGQIQGIMDMYENDSACIDVVRQVVAARNSLGTVAKKILSGEANRCTTEQRVEDLQDILQEVFRYS